MEQAFLGNYGKASVRVQLSVIRTKGRRAERSGRGSERGASAVEFALVVPIFLLFLFGIVQYGTIFLVKNQMTEAVSDAARSAISSTTMGGTNGAESVALAAVQQDLKHDGAGLMSADCSNSAVSCTAVPATNCNAPSGYQCLQVTITYNYGTDPVISFPFLPAPSSLSASSTVMIADPTGQ